MFNIYNMSSPSISNSTPKLRTKALNSGLVIHQGDGQAGFSSDIQAVGVHSDFQYLCQQSNTFYPLNNAMVQTGSSADINKQFDTSNQMFQSANYNVIKVDIDTTKTNNEQAINVFYSNDGTFKNAVRKYRTVIPSNYHFYRNFPVENDYFNIGIENLSNVDVAPARVSGVVTLSKFTQYNAPAQSQDLIDRYYFTDASRNTNNFTDDVVLSTDQDGEFKRLADVKPVSVMGITTSISNTKMTNWDATGEFAMTSNTFSDIALISDDAGDLNARFTIAGTGLNGKRQQETIICSGTANTIGALQYNFVDTINYLDGGGGSANVDDIFVNRLTNGETLCYSKDGSGRSTSLLHVMDEKESGVVKSISLSGRSGLVQRTRYELYRIRRSSTGAFHQELIFYHYIIDGEVNEVFPLNIQLNPFDRLVGRVRSSATGNFLTGDSMFNAKVDLHIYNVKPESVRKVNKV